MWLTTIGWELSPAYDLLNVKIILPKDKEDTALLLGGKKENFNKAYFNQFGTVLNLNDKQINGVYKRLEKWLPLAIQLIDQSFLSPVNKTNYKKLITKRVKIFSNS